MRHRISSRFACALGICLTTVATAASPPVLLDTEQKADAAVVAALRLKAEPWGDLFSVTNFARSELEAALQLLAGATTPAALMGARNGVTVPCATSGSLSARMARTLPRVLRLSYGACKFTDIDGYARERNGNAEVLLWTDSFTPEKVGAIRFGTSSSDFVDKRLIVYDDQITDEAFSLNLRMAGLIPMQRAFPKYGLFIGDFAFEVDGAFRIHDVIELPGSGLPPSTTDSSIEPRALLVSGTVNYDAPKTHSIEETRFHTGVVTRSVTYDLSPASITQYLVDGFRTRRESDFSDFNRATAQESLDGRIEYHYPAGNPFGAGCLSGAFHFKTRSPITRRVFGQYAFESGDLLINGTTAAKIYTAATVPAGLPTPVKHNLIHLDVANVGAFDYDSDGAAALQETAQCVY